MSRAAAVMVRSGRSARPATTQPSASGQNRHDGQREPGAVNQLVQLAGALAGHQGPRLPDESPEATARPLRARNEKE